MGKAWDALPNFCKTLVERIKTPPHAAPGIPTIAVSTFDVQGDLARGDAEVVTELFIGSLVARNDVRVVDRVNFDKIVEEMRFQNTDWSDKNKTADIGRVLNAGVVIRGQLMKMGNNIFWTATVLDVNTAQILSSSRQQMASLKELWEKNLLANAAQQIMAQLPPPNLFVGRWQSTYKPWGNRWYGSVPNFEMSVILNIQADGTIIVERYDTVTVIRETTRRVFSDDLNRDSWGSPNRNGKGTGIYTTIERASRESNTIIMSFSLNLNGINSNIPTRTEKKAYLRIADANEFALGSSTGDDGLSAGYRIFKTDGKIDRQHAETGDSANAYITYTYFSRLN
jgi:TolB-like protein